MIFSIFLQSDFSEYHLDLYKFDSMNILSKIHLYLTVVYSYIIRLLLSKANLLKNE